MNTYINYLLEANLCLLLCYGAYLLLLKNETNFTFKRLYLGFTVLASLLFPLFTIGIGNSSIPTIGQMMPAYILPEIVVGGGEKVEVITTPFFNVWKVVFQIYLLGLIVFTGKTIYQFIRLSLIIRKSKLMVASDGYSIYETNKTIPTFSFFKWIIIGEADNLSDIDKRQIISHEIQHIKNYHSIDILMVELARILFWFNPLVYPLKRNISDIHEYQADEKTVRDLDIQEYCSLLARITLQSAGISLANHFNKSLTVKRIEMMKTMKRKMKKWKIGAVAVVATGLFFTIACQDQIGAELNEMAQESTMALDVPDVVQQRLNEVKDADPDHEYLLIETTNLDGTKKDLDEIIKENGAHGLPWSLELIQEDIDGEEREFIIVGLRESGDELAEMTKQEGEIFTIVEDMAEPVEGFEELYAYIAQNILYPTEARENKISGRVFVEFIVEKDGSISNVQTKKGIGYGCDEEAERVVSSFNSWKPAKQRGQEVRQRMILPISFQMGNGEVNNHIIVDKANHVSVSEMKIEANSERIGNGMVKVTGRLYDGEGSPIKGAAVIIEGTTEGTVSDADGNFSIEKGMDQKLVFSHVSYGNKTVVLE